MKPKKAPSPSSRVSATKIGSSQSSKAQSSNSNTKKNSNTDHASGNSKPQLGGNYTCSGCMKLIRRDKFLLKACDKYWHEGCLRCDRCHAKLAELGSSLYCKSDAYLCRQDYLDLYGMTGICSVCDKTILAHEFVMKAKDNVYHLECFACQFCNLRFCVGEQFYLYENKIICQFDYEEHILPMEKSLCNHNHTDYQNNYHVEPEMFAENRAQVDMADQSQSSGQQRSILGSTSGEQTDTQLELVGDRLSHRLEFKVDQVKDVEFDAGNGNNDHNDHNDHNNHNHYHNHNHKEPHKPKANIGPDIHDEHNDFSHEYDGNEDKEANDGDDGDHDDDGDDVITGLSEATVRGHANEASISEMQ